VADEETVQKLVVRALEADWERHDLDAYFAIWTDDCKLIRGRTEAPQKADVVFDRKKLEAVVRLTRQGTKPDPNVLQVFEEVTGAVMGEKGDRAEVRVRIKRPFPGGSETLQEVYRLRRTPKGWMVSEIRTWPVELVTEKKTITYDDKTWEDLDTFAAEKKGVDDRGTLLMVALQDARRYEEAMEVAKKVTARNDVTHFEWGIRGEIAMQLGDTQDALESYRKALALDPKSPVPHFVHLVKEK
jgi:tetratricopeptide (TPR) repeat protein